MLMIEDKDQRGTPTARMILKKQTLLDWIKLVDASQTIYVLHEVEMTEEDTHE